MQVRQDLLLAAIRQRLSNISWWMRLLGQYIAISANNEDGEGLGRFWQSRYKAVRILDEETLLACAAYVDQLSFQIRLPRACRNVSAFGPWGVCERKFLLAVNFIYRLTLRGKKISA